MNAVMVKGDAVGPTLYYGPGAGAEPTASAVIADIVDVARSIGSAAENCVSALGFASETIVDPGVLDINDIESAYYLRASVLDQPGVLSSVAQIMSQRGISIEAIIQKEPRAGASDVPLIMLTSATREKNLRAAVEEIEALPSANGPMVTIRLDSLDA